MSGRHVSFLIGAVISTSVCWLLCQSAHGADAGSVDVLSGVTQFEAAPAKILPEHRPRLVVPAGPRQTVADPGPGAAFSASRMQDGFVFHLTGRVPEIRTMVWEAGVPRAELRVHPYYVLRYRARGQLRGQSPPAVISLRGSDADDRPASATLLDCAEVINDGLWHVIIGRQTAVSVASGLEIRLGTRDSAAMLELAECSFHETAPQPAAAFPQVVSTGPPAPGMRCIDLSKWFNDECAAAFARTLAAHGKVVDGGACFVAEQILAGGLPFQVRRDGRNLIAPPSNPTANSGTVDVLGTTLEKRLYKPTARDDSIAVPLTGHAGEIGFLLVAEMPLTMGRYALPSVPVQLHDLSTLGVEVEYASGEPDWAFPYSLADFGFRVQRAMGAYAVPADPARELKSVTFHNRTDDMTFSVAAVTLNSGADRMIPPGALNPPSHPVTRLSAPPSIGVQISESDGLFTIRNSHFEIRLDCRHGFGIDRVVHHWSPHTTVRLDAASGVELQSGDKVWTGRDLRTDRAVRIGNTIAVDLTSTDAELPVRMALTIAADASPQLRFTAQVLGLAPAMPPIDVHFPVLKRLSLGSAAESWLYFPQCRNVCTKEEGTYLAPNDRPFPLQFFDIFEPQAGIGIAFLTRNTNQDVLDYAVRKTREGIDAAICYPSAYHQLAQGKPRALTETCLMFHEGDWHRAFAAYREWLATWYRPGRSGGLDDWYRSFLLRAHLTAKAYSWTVPIYDAAANCYRIEDLLAEDRDYLGQIPDVVHLGGWVDLQNLHGGDFHGGDYAVEDYTGGVETLRAAIAQLQSGPRRASLYTIPDRCAKNSRIGTQCGPHIAQVGSDGKLQEDEKCWYVCLGAPPWQDHYVEALQRAQRETGVKAIYVDVFGYTRQYACYSPDHGHEVPLDVNKTCRELISRLREALPEGVAIWSEYPLTDVNSQFTNGNITYYFLTLHELLAPSYDQTDRAPYFQHVAQSIPRFALPNVKQFGFPVGFDARQSAHDLRALFFNGEGLYDVGYLLYDSRELARIRRWLAIQREYADCFTSRSPKPLIETAAGAIYANEFPGNARTAWTLYNGRFVTCRGPVLELEYRAGDTFVDAWTGQPVRPRIVGDRATIEMAIHPQEVGCIVRRGR